jgi:hypothetical protein
MITIQVYSKSSGTAQSGVQVVVYPNSSGGGYYEHTNSNGEAHYSSLSPGEHEVSIGGKTVHKGRIDGKQIVYV